MSNQTIADLRRHLFAALDGLTSKEAPMDIERARAVSEVAQVIINSAKVEVDHMKIAGAESGSDFLCAKPVSAIGNKSGQSIEKIPGGRVITHRLAG